MRVSPHDLEVWLCDYLRQELGKAGIDAVVDSVEPEDLRCPLSRPLVVIRDDSPSRESVVTFRHSVGISVLAGSRQNDREARTVSRLVYAIACDFDIGLVSGSPISAVDLDGCNGPYSVADDHDVARRYMTAAYSTVGEW